MTKTKVIARNNYNNRKKQFRRANQRRSNPKRPRAGIRNIERRVRNRDIKIKQLILQPEDLTVKKNGNIVRRMIVRQKTIFSAERKKFV